MSVGAGGQESRRARARRVRHCGCTVHLLLGFDFHRQGAGFVCLHYQVPLIDASCSDRLRRRVSSHNTAEVLASVV
jgi:hypothetical protein